MGRQRRAELLQQLDELSFDIEFELDNSVFSSDDYPDNSTSASSIVSSPKTSLPSQPSKTPDNDQPFHHQVRHKFYHQLSDKNDNMNNILDMLADITAAESEQWTSQLLEFCHDIESSAAYNTNQVPMWFAPFRQRKLGKRTKHIAYEQSAAYVKKLEARNAQNGQVKHRVKKAILAPASKSLAAKTRLDDRPGPKQKATPVTKTEPPKAAPTAVATKPVVPHGQPAKANLAKSFPTNASVKNATTANATSAKKTATYEPSRATATTPAASQPAPKTAAAAPAPVKPLPTPAPKASKKATPSTSTVPAKKAEPTPTVLPTKKAVSTTNDTSSLTNLALAAKKAALSDSRAPPPKKITTGGSSSVRDRLKLIELQNRPKSPPIIRSLVVDGTNNVKAEAPVPKTKTPTPKTTQQVASPKPAPAPVPKVTVPKRTAEGATKPPAKSNKILAMAQFYEGL